MSPRLTISYVSDRSPSHPKSLGQGRDGFSPIALSDPTMKGRGPNLFDGAFSQFCNAAARTLRLSVFRYFVSIVFSHRSKEKVFGVAARRVVASVKNAQSLRDFSKGQNPCPPMGEDLAAHAVAEMPIPKRRSVFRPLPTATLLFFQCSPKLLWVLFACLSETLDRTVDRSVMRSHKLGATHRTEFSIPLHGAVFSHAGTLLV